MTCRGDPGRCGIFILRDPQLSTASALRTSSINSAAPYNTTNTSHKRHRDRHTFTTIPDLLRRRPRLLAPLSSCETTATITYKLKAQPYITTSSSTSYHHSPDPGTTTTLQHHGFLPALPAKLQLSLHIPSTSQTARGNVQHPIPKTPQTIHHVRHIKPFRTSSPSNLVSAR